MGQKLEELPLFPLNTVLFPFATLQLHVFEDRYRQMIRECMEMDRGFGIVLIRPGAEDEEDPYLVGTAVRILSVHTYEDGRMDIQVQGERRFRIRGVDESRAFIVGRVEPVHEMPIEESDRAALLVARARQEFELFIQRIFSRQEFSVQVVFPDDPTALSFTIANMLQMENVEKQRLLETTDTLDRIEDLLPLLEMQSMEVHQPNYYRIGAADLQEYITPN